MAYWEKRPPLYGVSVPGIGPLPATHLFILDRPGKNDPRAGVPLTGVMGMEFDRYLRLARLTRGQVRVTHLVRDYRDDDITQEEIERDQLELLHEIEECDPSVICPLGRMATRYFMGDVDMEKVHGLAFDGGEFGHPGRTLYPANSPAGGIYSSDQISVIHHDFAGLGDIASRQWRRADLPTSYRSRVGTDMLDPAQPLSIDSEGWLDAPWSLQTSQQVGTGLIIHRYAAGEFARIFNKFWSAGGRVQLHNSLHDLGVLSNLGIYVRDDQFVDTMVLAYLLCLEPQGLKPLAFRHAGLEMSSYEEVIAPARDLVHREWLEGALAVAESIPPPELELVWDDKIDGRGGWRVKKPYTIAQRLRRLTTDLAKGEVDIAARVGSWEDTAADELRRVAGDIPEPSLSDIPREVAERYACQDADATHRIAPILVQKVKEEGLEEICKIDHDIIPMVNRMQQVGFRIDPTHFQQMETELTEEMGEIRDRIEEMVGVRINPSSPPQVSSLLFKQLGLPSRKLTKTGADSTQDKVLEGLRSSHPVLPLILDYRERDKIRGSFCRVMPRLADRDNRIHCNLRVTRTASGRIAANTPNLMAIPVRSALGRRLRRGFVARPGYVIGNWDLDQIEMRVIADESGDALLHELFSDPSRDIHSETAARMFDKPIARIDAKTERYAAKRVGFGIATQITGHGLVDQMELAGATHADGSKWTEDECDNLIELWFGVYPGVRSFIDRTKAGVRRSGVVRDRWGRLRYLSGVWSSIDRIREEALRQGPSHIIQAGAQGLMKKIMKAIWDIIKDMDEVYPILQIHDSIMLEFPEWMWEMMNEMVIHCMETTVQLSVPVTASGERGENWGQMKEAE